MKRNIYLVSSFLLVLAISQYAAASGYGQSSGKRDDDAALRNRVADFYALMRLKKAADAEKFVTSDTLDQFRLMPNGEFLAAEIDSIEMGKDQNSASVLINLVVSNASIPVPFKLPRKTNWRIEEGNWKIVIPSQTIEQSGPGVIFGGSRQTSQNPPKFDLEFPKSIVNLTPIRQGEKKLATFAFTNSANHPVTIVDVKSDCICIVLKSGKKTYQPGEAGELVLEFDSSNYAYDYRQTVAVITDPGKQIINLLLSASISPKY